MRMIGVVAVMTGFSLGLCGGTMDGGAGGQTGAGGDAGQSGAGGAGRTGAGPWLALADPPVETGVPYARCPAATGKSVVLTFDDGPSPLTDKLLDMLQAKKAHAAFFVIAKRLDPSTWGYMEHRRKVKRIADEGHEICNHTYSHNGLRGMTDAGVLEEMTKAENLLAEVTGRRTRCMRPPGGDQDARVLGLLRGLGYKVVMWSINTMDWKYASKERPNDFNPPKILELVQQETQKATGTQPLIHVQHDSEVTEAAVALVPQVIDQLRGQGWSTIRLSQCLGGAIDAPR